MEAPGFLLYLPPTALKPRFVMIEEGSKMLYDVDVTPAEPTKSATWNCESSESSPKTVARQMAIVIPDRLGQEHKLRIAASGFRPEFEVGRLVLITNIEGTTIRGSVIGKMTVCPFDHSVLNWDLIKDMKGAVIHDEMRNGLLARVFGGRNADDHSFIHPGVLEGMPRRWHEDGTLLNAELDGIFASGQAVTETEYKWILDDDDDNDDDSDD